MKIRVLLALALSVLLSSNVLAASGSRGHPGEQRSHRDSQGSQAESQGSLEVRIISRAESVPELDGSMAFLALGLTFAAAGLVREKRRNS